MCGLWYYFDSEVIPILVESEDPLGPFGAKGLGEPGLVPVVASINNVIYNKVLLHRERLPFDRRFQSKLVHSMPLRE